MIRILKAQTAAHYKDFVQFPFKLYADNKYWVPPISKEELEVIDQSKNPVFQNADASFFLAYKNDKLVGRIAAMVNWIEVNELRKRKVRKTRRRKRRRKRRTRKN